MNFKIEHIIILILIGYILFLQQCTEPKKIYIKDSQKEITKEVYIDTILFNYPVPVEYKIPIKEPIASTIDPIDSSIINKYELPIEDSLLTGKVSTMVDGTLLDMNFTYTPKFPKYINKETIITEKLKPKNMLFITGGLEGGKTFFSPKLGLSLYQKKGYLYSATYDPINKLYGVGIGIQLTGRNNVNTN